MKEFKAGRAKRFLALPCLLLVMSNSDCEGPQYKFIERRFGGKVYRTFYDNTSNPYTPRIQTFEVLRDGELKDIGGNRSLGSAIEVRGMELSGGTEDTLPNMQSNAARSALGRVNPQLLVLDVLGDRVLKFDVNGQFASSQFSLGQLSPVAMRLSPDETRIFVLHRRQNAIGTIPARPAAVVILRFDSLNLERRIDLPDGINPQLSERGLEISADGKFLYFVNDGSTSNGASSIVRMDIDRGSVLNSIPSPRANFSFGPIRLSPDGATLYTRASSFFYAIDVASQSVAYEVLAGGGSSLVVHPNGTLVYCSRNSPPGIQVINAVTATAGELISVPGGRSISQLHIEPDGQGLIFNDDQGGALYSLRFQNLLLHRLQTGTGNSQIVMEKP